MKKRVTINFPIDITVFCSFIIFKLVLDHVTTNALTIFSDTLSSATNRDQCAISWTFYVVQIAILSVMIKNKRSLSTVLYAFLWAVNGVGFYTLFGRVPSMTMNFFLLVNLFWFCFSIAIMLLKKQTAPTQDKISPITKSEWCFLAIVAVCAIVISGVYGNFRFGVAFEDVYEYRMNLNIPTAVGYLFRFTSGVFLPYLFVRFLVNKKYVVVGVIGVLAILIYSVDGLKTSLVLYAIIIAFCVLYNMSKSKANPGSNMLSMFLMLLTLFIAVNYWGYKQFDQYFFLDETYSVLLIPNVISNNYYLYIVDREALFLRESILRVFFDSPYEESISYLVTNIVTEHGRAVANTGMIGDAYANFKLFGMCTYPIMYSFIFWLWQKSNQNKINATTVSIGFIMLWNAINVSFFTWLLTGGVVIYLIINRLLRSKQNSLSKPNG